MNGKKIASTFIVALFLVSSAVIVANVASESSDAATTYTAEYYPDRTAYRYLHFSGDFEHDGIPVNNPTLVAMADAIAQEYANGKRDSLDVSLLFETVAPESYYYEYTEYKEYGLGADKTFTSERTTTMVPLQPGTYKFCLKSATHNGEELPNNETVSLRYSISNYYYNIKLDRNAEVEFKLDAIGTFYLEPNIDKHVHFEYEITPAPITEKYNATEPYALDTRYKWYVGEMTLRPATYIGIGDEETITISDPDKQSLFEKEIIQQNKVFTKRTGDVERYKVLNPSFNDEMTITSNTHVKVYCLKYSMPYEIYIREKTETGSTNSYVDVEFTPIATGNKEFKFYATAFETFDLCVDYDSREYGVYLEYVTDQSYRASSLLVPGILYHVDNGKAKSYSLIGEINDLWNIEDQEKMTVDVKVYTNNTPEPDTNVLTFAIVCIMICAIVFVALALSGLKPVWERDDRPRTK